MHLGYDKKNGVLYAKICRSHRDGDKVTKTYVYLGRVLDAERGIYQNRERGIFTYDPATDTYGSAPPDFVPDASVKKRQELLLDFGDVYFLDRFLRDSGLMDAVTAAGRGDPDTLRALLCYYILCPADICCAETWWEGSYARVLYPGADLSEGGLDDLLASVGEGSSLEESFRSYFRFLEGSGRDPSCVLLDITGLPRDARFPVTAVTGPGGELRDEVRLLYALQPETGMPVCFRCCPAGGPDDSAVPRFADELGGQGFPAELVITDGEDLTGCNVRLLYGDRIPFAARLPEGHILYRELLREHRGALERREDLLRRGGQYICKEKFPCSLYGRPAYAYLGLDPERRALGARTAQEIADAEGTAEEEARDASLEQGVFALVSSRELPAEQILTAFELREGAERAFSIGRYYEGLPPRIRTEGAFRGHLLLAFLATAASCRIEERLKGTSLDLPALLGGLRNQKCRVTENKVYVSWAGEEVRGYYGLWGMECPTEIVRKKH